MTYTPLSVTVAVLTQMGSATDKRLESILESAVRHFHDFAREVNLALVEWLKAIEFFTRVGKTCTQTRQEFILLSDIVGLSTLVNTLHDATATEKATSGSLLRPFFREDAPQLPPGEQISKDDKSEEILLWGTVRSAAGEALPNAKLMVWQTSSSGHYDLQEGDGSAIDSRGSGAEICVAIASINSLVTRSTGGVVDRTIAERGTIWLSPPGPKECLFDVSAPVPQVLHIYLPSQHFSADSLGIDADAAAAHTSLRYERSFQDPLVAEIAFAIVSEMRTQTAGSSLLAETLAVSLAARLVHSHSGLSPNKDLEQLSHQGLDRRRLTRVREYIAANLEGDLTIAQLAKVACLSRFHFARAFKTAVGQPPHQYVSARRLERAKEMLMRGNQSLLDIAIALNFSSQANFTRAFRAGTGMTPGQFRRDFARC